MIYTKSYVEKVTVRAVKQGGVGVESACCLPGITKVALKAFVEGVRLQTLGRTGLQQIQLDVHFLRQHLGRY